MTSPDTYIVRLPLGSSVDHVIWRQITDSGIAQVGSVNISWPVSNAMDPVFLPLRSILHFL